MPKPRTRSVDRVTPAAAPHSARPRIVASDVLFPLLIEAATSLDSVAPLLLPCRVLAYRDSLPPGLAGAYAALSGGCDSLYLGVLADETSSVSMARRMLKTGSLDERRVRTAMCDIAERLAQGFGRRLRTKRSITVTVPMFVNGIVQSSRDQGLRAAEVVLGVTRATLVLVALRRENGMAEAGEREALAGEGYDL